MSTHGGNGCSSRKGDIFISHRYENQLASFCAQSSGNNYSTRVVGASSKTHKYSLFCSGGPFSDSGRLENGLATRCKQFDDPYWPIHGFIQMGLKTSSIR